MFTMNKKGFGLPEVLVFMGISMFILIVISIYLNRYFHTDNKYDTKITDKSIMPAEDTDQYYQDLEDSLKNASLKYSFDKNNDYVITVKMLKRANLLKELKDPVVSTNTCEGYVLYSYKDSSYKPYIACDGTYTTFGFDNKFVN